MQNFQDNETVIVTRGTKSLAKGTEATVLGYDQPTDSYAVRIEVSGDITRYTNVKASSLGPKPERTFTESEIWTALYAVQENEEFKGHPALKMFSDRLGL